MMRKARHIVQLWQSLGLGRVPTRDRLKIYNFPALQPHLFVAEVAKRIEDYRFVLAGSAVEKSYGAELTGLTFGELDLGPAKSQIMEEYELCAQKREAIASCHQMRVGDDGVIELQRVLLPFDAPNKEGVAQVVGWFHLAPALKRAVKGSVSRWTTAEREFIRASD